jgi:multidrug efflux pump subunit AcrA (membrane-fusion protein)
MNGQASRIWGARAAVGLLVAVLVGCGGGASAAKGPGTQAGGAQKTAGRFLTAVPVQSVVVHVGPLRTDNLTAGSVVPATQSMVASQVAGVTLAVAHQAGDWVKAGATVVQLDDSQLKLAVKSAESNLAIAKINEEIGQDDASQSNPKLQLQVQSAQSALDSAQKNFDSQKALFDVGGISGSQLDTAKSQLQQAQANLEAAKTALDQNNKSGTQTLAQLKLAVDQAQNAVQIARLNLQFAAIKAPFAGQIAAVNVNPGVYVGLATAVFSLVSAEKEVSFNVPPADAPTLSLGSTIRFSYLGKDYPARVSQAPSAPINGTVPMVAELPRSANLPYGTVGTVTYTVTLATGTLIPIAALQVNEDQNYVFIVENGKAATRPITIFAETGTTAAVSGLTEAAQVVLSPPPGLLPGSSVQVISLAPVPAPPPAGTGGGPVVAPAGAGRTP